MQAQNRAYKSAKQAWAAGSALEFHGFVPARGPNGGRNVIDGFDVVAELTDINVATTAIQGSSLTGRAFKRIMVEQVGGISRWNLRGDESRVMCYQLEGAERVKEHADSAAANDQNLTVSLYIPMAKRFAKRPRDFALPADLFFRLAIECADLAELGVDGGTVTIDSARYYVLAHTHEEFQVELHSEDVVAATPFPSTDGVTIKSGGRIADLVIFARGAAGGASMANFTDARIENLMPVALARDPDLIQPYLRDRYNVKNMSAAVTAAEGGQVREDPVAVGKAVPILHTTEDSSVFDGPIFDELVLYTTNTVASCIALHRTVRPLSAGVAESVMGRYGLTPKAFRMKSAGKSKRDWGKWPAELGAFMPKVAPLRNFGR